MKPEKDWKRIAEVSEQARVSLTHKCARLMMEKAQMKKVVKYARKVAAAQSYDEIDDLIYGKLAEALEELDGV